MSNQNGPKFLRPCLVKQFVAQGLIAYTPASGYAFLFGETFRLSFRQDQCFEALWENLFRGNLPMRQSAILAYTEDAKSKHLADIFKRNPAWRKWIRGDGKGGYWLSVPDWAIGNVPESPSEIRVQLQPTR